MTPTRYFEIVTDQDMEKVWGNANFGSRHNRAVVDEAVLKMACGYQSGSTALAILFELRLQAHNALTAKGRQYLWSLYGEGMP